MPCIYFIHCVCGALGSRFLMYKYSAICRNIPIAVILCECKNYKYNKRRLFNQCCFRNSPAGSFKLEQLAVNLQQSHT